MRTGDTSAENSAHDEDDDDNVIDLDGWLRTVTDLKATQPNFQPSHAMLDSLTEEVKSCVDALQATGQGELAPIADLERSSVWKQWETEEQNGLTKAVMNYVLRAIWSGYLRSPGVQPKRKKVSSPGKKAVK